MNGGSVVLWGFLATIALTSVMQAGMGLGLSRMSLPFIVGTIFTGNRDRALVIGMLINALAGWVFAGLYALVFDDIGWSSWWLGAAGGMVHGLAILLILMPLLPAFHPRMASERRGPEPTRALEPPGFLALNYGRRTPGVILIAHVVYGVILGAMYKSG